MAASCISGTTRNGTRRTGLRGFTLLEVMVALAILGLSMAAAIRAVSTYTANEIYLRDRTVAFWVAGNLLTQYQLAEKWPETGRITDTVEYARRRWDTVVTVTQTEEEAMRRLDVEVRVADQEGTPLGKVSGFVQETTQ